MKILFTILSFFSTIGMAYAEEGASHGDPYSNEFLAVFLIQAVWNVIFHGRSW